MVAPPMPEAASAQRPGQAAAATGDILPLAVGWAVHRGATTGEEGFLRRGRYQAAETGQARAATGHILGVVRPKRPVSLEGPQPK